MSPRHLIVSVPTIELRDALIEVVTDVTVLVWDMSGPTPARVIDIVVPPYMGQASVLGRLTDVTTRLVQSQMVGYDGVREALPPGPAYANATTVHETSTAELTLALILASQRGIPDFVRASGG